MAISFDLNTIKDINTVIKDNDDKNAQLLKVIHKYWQQRGQTYKILKYDKEFLTLDRTSTVGLVRSVITKNDSILSYSPPKSLPIDIFKNMYNINECIGQEIIEGTMINVFFDKDLEEEGDWEIATRSTIGGNVCFYRDGPYDKTKSFRYMFLDVCEKVGLDFDMLPKEYSYSFVFQHPNNRIVVPFNECNLYLIAVYEIKDMVINVIPSENILAHIKNTRIRLPETVELSSYDKLIDMMYNYDDYRRVGIMVHHKISGARTKIKNSAYEEVKKLRGTNPKLQYQYLELRKLNKIDPYLYFFPENSNLFSIYREQLYEFTHNLHANYLKCYVKKNAQLNTFPHKYKNHMFILHKQYLNNPTEIITFRRVKEYVNNLPSAQLMYSLNYHLRQHNNHSDNDDN